LSARVRRFTLELRGQLSDTCGYPLWPEAQHQAQNTGSTNKGPERVIRRIALSFFALLSGFIIAWLMVLALGITVPLDILRDPIETAASHALGREVRVLGPIDARPTLGPTIVVHGLRITDPGRQAGTNLLMADRVEARLGLIDLLRGRFYVTRFLIQNASVKLQTRRDGSRNWHTANNRAAVNLEPSRRQAKTRMPEFRQRELQAFSLRNIVLSYQDDRTGLQYLFKLDEVSGSAMPGRPLDLLIRGGIRQETCVVHLSGGYLSDLLAYSGNWPLHVMMTMAGTSLVLNGTLDASQPDQGPALDFELHAERMTAAEASVIRGRLTILNDGLDLRVREARLGQSTLQGRVSVRFDAPHPHLIAELEAPTLDAALLTGVGGYPDHPAGGSSTGRLADTPAWLGAVDLDAAITVGEFVHSPIDIRNVNLKLTSRDGTLNAPLNALIADAPFQGTLSVNRQRGHPAVKLTLDARNVNAEKLIENLTGLDGIRGKFNRIEFHAATSDTVAGDRLEGFDIGLNITGAKFSYGNSAGGRPVGVALDDLAVTIPRGKKLSVIAHGSLLNDPLIIELTGGTLENLIRHEEWPVDLTATGNGATLGINGTLADASGQSQTRMNLVLSGERLGDLADWFGVSPCADPSYTARGQLIISGYVRRLQFLQAQLGKTQLDGDLDWSVDERTPLLHALVHFDALNPDDLDGLVPIVKFGNARGNKMGIAIDLPLLPRRIEITNADIRLTSEILHLKPVEITDASLTSQIRGGKLMRSPFHAHIGGTGFTGYLEPSGTATDVVFEIDKNDKDSGSLLNKLFSTTVRWAGSAAVIPMQWLFKRELPAESADDCRTRLNNTPNHP
jgi:uncharacterized protein involved in outer membrane biogenesis